MSLVPKVDLCKDMNIEIHIFIGAVKRGLLALNTGRIDCACAFFWKRLKSHFNIGYNRFLRAKEYSNVI